MGALQNAYQFSLDDRGIAMKGEDSTSPFLLLLHSGSRANRALGPVRKQEFSLAGDGEPVAGPIGLIVIVNHSDN